MRANLQVEHIAQVLQIRNRKTSWSLARATHQIYRSISLPRVSYTHLVILSHSRATSYDSHQFSSFFHFSTDSLPVATFGVPSCPIHVHPGTQRLIPLFQYVSQRGIHGLNGKIKQKHVKHVAQNGPFFPPIPP